MLLVLAMDWMVGTWYPPPPVVNPVLKDINGDIINIGDTVYLIGTVNALYPLNLQYGSVGIMFSYPVQSTTENIKISSLSCLKP